MLVWCRHELRVTALTLHVSPALQVVNLSADPEAAGQRMMHWNSEVAEMQRRVYPLMAAQQHQQQQ
jgi:hypothetical protein